MHDWRYGVPSMKMPLHMNDGVYQSCIKQYIIVQDSCKVDCSTKNEYRSPRLRILPSTCLVMFLPTFCTNLHGYYRHEFPAPSSNPNPEKLGQHMLIVDLAARTQIPCLSMLDRYDRPTGTRRVCRSWRPFSASINLLENTVLWS